MGLGKMAPMSATRKGRGAAILPVERIERRVLRVRRHGALQRQFSDRDGTLRTLVQLIRELMSSPAPKKRKLGAVFLMRSGIVAPAPWHNDFGFKDCRCA